jgi:hypothetical protein
MVDRFSQVTVTLEGPAGRRATRLLLYNMTLKDIILLILKVCHSFLQSHA